MALLDYQRSYRGLLLGEGTAYDIIEEDGVESLTVRDGDREFPRASGSIPGKHYAESKVIVLTTEVVGPLNDTEELFDNFKKAFQLSEDEEYPYVFKNPGQDERFIWARTIRRPRVRTLASELGVTQMQVALKAADPRVYSTTRKNVTVPLFQVGGGGFNLPTELPLDMTEPTKASAVAVNEGDAYAYPLVRFQHSAGSTATVNGVTLTNVTNGDVLTIATSIAPGQTLVADMGAAVRGTGDLIVYIDNASHYNAWALPRSPFRLTPGDNTLTLTVDGTATTELVCVVSFRDTYL